MSGMCVFILTRRALAIGLPQNERFLVYPSRVFPPRDVLSSLDATRRGDDRNHGLARSQNRPTAILTPQSFLPSEDKQSEWDLGRSSARCGTDHPHPPDREQLGAAIVEIQKVCYEWCVYGHCCGRGQRPDGSATGVVNPLVRAIVRPRPSRHTNSV